MTWWRRLRLLLPSYRRAAERDMRDELDSLSAIAQPGELGNLTLAAENARAAWGWTWLESIAGDLRYAFRVLLRDRSFTAVAVLSLGLAIGANAAIFSLMEILLLRALPVHEPRELVSFDPGEYTYTGYTGLRDQSRGILSGLLATSGAVERDVDAGAGPRPASVEFVSGDYFAVLGVPSAVGRLIAPEDDQPGVPSSPAVISYGLWQRAYAGEPSAIGQTIRVQKAPFTIAGVAPRDFFGITVGHAPDVWIPLTSYGRVFPGPEPLGDHHVFLSLTGRLPPGTTRQRAASALTPIVIRLDLAHLPPNAPAFLRQQILTSQLSLVPAEKGTSALRDRFSQPLRVVSLMVAIGLLLACVNVMSLQFARADQRRRELTVRLAIGAGRRRIVRQLLTEAFVVALLGGVLGLALCRPAASALVSMLSLQDSPVQLDLSLRSSILLFVLAVSLAVTLVTGVVPAMRATRGELLPGLQQASRASVAPVRRTLGRAVAALQIALSVVLIGATFLFSFSLQKLLQFDTGLDRRNLVVLSIDSAEAGYRDARALELNRRLLEVLHSNPAVASVSFSGNGIYEPIDANAMIDVEGYQSANRRDRMSFFDLVGPRYFTTLGTRLVAGRDFDEHDDAGRGPVAIVNQEFVRHFFRGNDPLGRTIYRPEGSTTTAYRIVGVARDIRTNIRKTPRVRFYLPQLQAGDDFGGVHFLVRTRRAPSVAIPELRAAIHSADASVRIQAVATADQLLDRTVDLDRLIAALSSAFGILAIVLAMVGIYGLMAYDVTRRTAEIGVRMALGATRPAIMRLVFREVLTIAAVGVAFGILASRPLGRLVASLVFGLEPGDPRVLAAAIAVLLTSALFAAWIPARRAARLDPLAALRNE